MNVFEFFGALCGLIAAVGGGVAAALLGYGFLGGVVGFVLGFLAGWAIGVGIGHLVLIFQRPPDRSREASEERHP